jgi:hypothetical protein
MEKKGSNELHLLSFEEVVQKDRQDTDMAKQGKARQGRTRQSKARQGKSKARPGKTRPGNTKIHVKEREKRYAERRRTR